MNSTLEAYEKRDADFLASIRIYPCGPKTRTNPPFNGIRWNFIFKQDVDTSGLDVAMRQMILPEFVDSNGDTIADKVPLSGTLSAKLHVLAVSDCAPKILVGTEFYCAEGARIVASGVVTSLVVDLSS